MATSTPNFSLTGNPLGTLNQTNNMSSTTPMGTPAKAPQTAPPVNTISSSQVKPISQTQTAAVGNTTPGSTGASTGNTGLVGSPSAIDPNTYGKAATGLLGYGDIQNDPQYQKMIGEYYNIQANQPQALSSIMNDTTRGIPNAVEQSRIGATNDQYSAQLTAKQNEISNYLAGRGQNISALGSAAGVTSPSSQLGFLTNPLTGQPIYGNGSIEGLAGLSYQAGKINNAGALAGQGQGQAISINNARNTTTQLSNLLKTSNLNQNQLAAANWFGNVVAQNLSNPTLAPIQNAITSAVNQYAQAIGVSPADLTSSLLSQSGSQSILAVLGNLDTQAYNNYSNTGNIANGGGVSAPATNLGTAPNAASGTTSGGNKYVITP